MQTDPDKLASGNRGPAHKERRDEQGGSNARHSRLAQHFTDNLEDLEPHVPAHSSERENSDSEGDAFKVGDTKKRKHNIYIHFSKDQNCDICLKTEITRVPCRRRDKRSIDNRGSQSPQRRKGIPEQSPIRCRGTRSRQSKPKLRRRR